MSATFALILLAEAAAVCALGGRPELGGGASIIRPVGTFAPLPFERLGPTESVVAEPTIQQVTATEVAEGDDAAQPTERCVAANISIA